MGDSLLHGAHPRRLDLADQEMLARVLKHTYEVEDAQDLARILGRPYNAVVGNPPYIAPKDPALRAAYRELYASCHGKYALAAPFTERFFELALDGRAESAAGHVGMIVANSFMKREFGKRLVEEVLPKLDLTHVIDTAGAYIPGHGTPTAILFGRNRAPAAVKVRTVMGIMGEPGTPDDPARGLVWSAIVAQIDQPGSESAYVSVADTDRASFAKHPWSIGGGGANELKNMVEDAASNTLDQIVASVGITSFTLEDELFLVDNPYLCRHRIDRAYTRPMVVGDEVRDFSCNPTVMAIFPYERDLSPMTERPGDPIFRHLWLGRTHLSNSKMFGGRTKAQSGLRWYEYGRLTAEKLRTQLSITFAFVATHSHFVLDRGGKVFNRTAPVIKLPAGASEDDHLALLGLLNCSTLCFWMKQVFQNRGATVDDRGARQRTLPFEDFYEFTSTGLLKLPLAEPYPTDLARQLDALARTFAANLPSAVAERGVPTREALDAARITAEAARAEMIALQEELDWRCYRLYGLIDDDLGRPSPPSLRLGERAFEIIMARQMATGRLETAWFERNDSTPVTKPPAHWPADYRALVEQRITLIENDRYIGLIERPEYKRRWRRAGDSWEEQEHKALRVWLLNRLEDVRYWSEPTLLSTSLLADIARRDPDFLAVGALYSGRPDFDVSRLVRELVESEAVPFLPVLRYTASGLDKHREWERTWALQREEDATGHGLEIPVPPKYRQADLRNGDWWRLRGPLDVPKERFVLYLGAERDADPSPVVIWAGFDQLQQALALATYAVERKDSEGWGRERLVPLLAGLLDLLPWLKQWHNGIEPTYGQRMADYVAGFLDEQLRGLGISWP